MSTYVMSDIHGCYREFQRMLEQISFSASDRLILAGDSIERGAHSYEMLQWLACCPPNVLALRGNHEQEFAAYVDLMGQLDQVQELETDVTSNKETTALYWSLKYYLKNSKAAAYFDHYGTIIRLLVYSRVTMEELCQWAKMIRRMPYYQELRIGGKTCMVVHAGYAESQKEIGAGFASLEDFYLYAREESWQLGGKRHAMVIAGHTPTIIPGRTSYNRGNVWRYYDRRKDCMFYDIDCGCVFRGHEPDAKLACIRLEDEKVFYV